MREEDPADQFAAAPYAGLVEDALQMLLHGLGRDFEALRDIGGGESLQHETRDILLSLRQAIGGQDDEAFYVLDGEVTFFLGGSPPIRASAGAFVHIPGGAAHAFQVESPTARYLIITTPRHASFYRAIAEPARERSIPPAEDMNMEVIGAACETYGIELVVPVPEAVA